MTTKFFPLFFFISIFIFSQKRDSIIVPFPEKYQLTLKHNQENEHIIFREWIPKKETFDNYSIIFTTIITKNSSSVPLDSLKKSLFETYNKKTVGAKFTEIARELDYIIFKSEVDFYKREPKSEEAQLYFLTKGEKDLFTISVALKKKKLPNKFIEEWVKIFKNSKFIKNK